MMRFIHTEDDVQRQCAAFNMTLLEFAEMVVAEIEASLSKKPTDDEPLNMHSW